MTRADVAGIGGEIEPRLRVRGVSKSFGETRALVDVDLSVEPGEIHALLGQNGSGKSTLVKILSGYWAPDGSCDIAVDGRMLRVPIDARELRREGMAFVHQDLGIIDSLSVLDNVCVGTFAARRASRSIRRQRETASVQHSLRVLGCEVEPRALAGRLSASERARVAIARALRGRREAGGVIVFDEATRALPRDATSAVHVAIQRIAAEGVSVLLVSHRLDEVIALAHRATVLRDGKVVAAGVELRGMTEADLATLMLGHEVDALPGRAMLRRSGEADVVTVSGVVGEGVSGIDLSIGRGEIVGVTGVAGSGHEALPYLLTGAVRARSGALTVGERRIDLRNARHRDFVSGKVALIPERRDVNGLVLSRSIRDNVTLPRVRLRGSRFFIGRSWQEEEAELVLRTFQVNTSDPGRLVEGLSGGNRQKILLGKWLLGTPDFLVVHEPTQGVDVGARQEILRMLANVASRGCSILMVSAEPDDLAILCDRVVILRDGKVALELQDRRSPAEIVAAVYGRIPSGDAAPEEGRTLYPSALERLAPRGDARE